MFQIKTRLQRREKRLLQKLDSWGIYKSMIALLCAVFAFHKVFLVLQGPKMKKVLGMASIRFYKIFGKKIGYIDDFIVHKKYRGKGIGSRIFGGIQKKIHDEKSDYMFLVSRSDREKSHKMYKKFGFTILSLGIGIVAYKKFIHKK